MKEIPGSVPENQFEILGTLTANGRTLYALELHFTATELLSTKCSCHIAGPNFCKHLCGLALQVTEEKNKVLGLMAEPVEANVKVAQQPKPASARQPINNKTEFLTERDGSDYICSTCKAKNKPPFRFLMPQQIKAHIRIHHFSRFGTNQDETVVSSNKNTLPAPQRVFTSTNIAEPTIRKVAPTPKVPPKVLPPAPKNTTGVLSRRNRRRNSQEGYFASNTTLRSWK